MQTKNENPPIRLTGRHIVLTEAMENYFLHRLAALHLDYPAILDIHGLLSLEKYRHRADLILRCNRQITIKTSSETDDMYASIDQAVDRTARKMRKYHTQLMRAGLPRRKSVRRLRFVSNRTSRDL
jgi:putative sigma-54 modulation protein